jgi:hypothetical protein
MYTADPITNEADIINRTDITARLAWLERSLATPAVLDGLPDLDALARQEAESREHAALTTFVAACDTAVGGGQDWGAVRCSYWDTYAADTAAEMFGDAVAQHAWSHTRWAAEYTEGWHNVRFGTVVYRVRP